ncbi:hypothetical protein NEPTK9_000171 [Candidatus Neptunochlamydia vexilliferae]|uniref:Uncharacterized protein n=1 Tax=Candidatus Neptunichlamydia vexilliferae TaxID=1651774 RepID=A0ABS0AX16_9BACT|nr:hypothetical protein [Candidatus Neptunochlamydia vexilliferae]
MNLFAIYDILNFQLISSRFLETDLSTLSKRQGRKISFQKGAESTKRKDVINSE